MRLETRTFLPMFSRRGTLWPFHDDVAAPEDGTGADSRHGYRLSTRLAAVDETGGERVKCTRSSRPFGVHCEWEGTHDSLRVSEVERAAGWHADDWRRSGDGGAGPR